MELILLVKTWFDKWADGDYLNLPISENFKHTSPYGTISGKKQYLDLIEANKENFLRHRLELHDGIYEKNRACVRYTAIQGEFTLDVSEWYFLGNDQIEEIVSSYNIEGGTNKERKLDIPQ